MPAPLGLAPGSVIADRYETEHELGRGERSIVYAARDRETGAELALKLVTLSPATAHFARTGDQPAVVQISGFGPSGTRYEDGQGTTPGQK